MCSGFLAITVMYPLMKAMLSSSSYMAAGSPDHMYNTSCSHGIWLTTVVSAVHSLPDVPFAFLLVWAKTSSLESDSSSVVGRNVAGSHLRWLVIRACTWSTMWRASQLYWVVDVGHPLLSVPLLVLSSGSSACLWTTQWEVRLSTFSSFKDSLALVSLSTDITSLRLGSGSSSWLNASMSEEESSGGCWSFLHHSHLSWVCEGVSSFLRFRGQCI